MPARNAGRKATLLIGAGAVALVGCVQTNRVEQSAVRPHLAASHDQAASVHVAVLSTTPFERIKNELQPRFEMDEKQAVAAVVPNTQLLVERVLDVVQRSLSLTTPQTSTSSTTTTTSATGAKTTVNRESTDTREPGEDPAAPAFPGGDRTAAGITAPTPAAPNDRAVDPFTTYKAAAALLQEVRLLNQYVVAQQLPEGAVAQVVRLQISVLPYARNQPYDVYTNVSFFPENDRGGALMKSVAPNVQSSGAALVIPLLATDNFEASSQSSAADSVQQATFSLLGLVQGFGLGAGNARLLDELRTVTGRELNALTTTSRLTNNTLRVRLGAPFNNRAAYAMVPQTYNISAVVIVPTGTKGVNVIARTTLRNAITGADLPDRTRNETARLACERLTGYPELAGNPLRGFADAFNRSARFCSRRDGLQDGGGLQRSILAVLQHLEFGRYSDFYNALTKEENRTPPSGTGAAAAADSSQEDQVTALWAGFAELLTGSRYSRTWFGIVELEPTWPAPQTVMAADDDKIITATIGNGRDLPAGGIAAELRVARATAPARDVACDDSAAPVADGTLVLEAASVEVRPGFAVVALTFPSPKLLGIERNAAARACVVLKSNAPAIAKWAEPSEKSSPQKREGA